jgi:uncharacterized membrane protein
MTLNKTIISVLALCILYAVGLFGTVFWGLDLMPLTAVNLLISAVILFVNHTNANTRLFIYSGVVFVSGWLIEWAGVETGRIFGQYFYGNNLGLKLLDIPVIIGMNWLLLSYCSSVVANRIFANSTTFNTFFPKVFVGALLMVLVDFFIEQVAPTYDFWYWKNQLVPLQNYSAWFAFAFAFNFLFQHLQIDNNNKVAVWLYGLMLLFFVGLNVL